MYQKATANIIENSGNVFVSPLFGIYKDSGTHPTPVNIYKTDDSYEVMVFAPGRIKENFSVTVSGEELIIDYCPTIDMNAFQWVRKEYGLNGFERTFLLDDMLDAESIRIKYKDGVLKFSVKIIPQQISL